MTRAAYRKIFAAAFVLGLASFAVPAAIFSFPPTAWIASVVLCALSAAVVSLISGRVARTAKIAGPDIRSLEQSVASLEAERARSELVLDSMTEAVIALNDERRIALINSAALTLLGISSPPIGRSLLEVLRAPALQALVDGVPTPQAGTAEVSLRAGERRVLARVTPQRAGGCIIVMHDITEIRRLETIRRDFVANVSHELRTPVSIIRANAETLLAGAHDDPEVAPKLLEGLHRNAERLARIISDLLDLSRLEAGKLALSPEFVVVRKLAAQAARALEAAAQKRRITVEITAPEALMCTADPKALDQVLTNLLDNAIKYTPEGGHVWIGAREKATGVIIEVEDDGPGITAEHRARLFERFYRVDPGRSRAMGGTGLGLAIVKHLVEGMGGDIGVAPRKPRGSRFWVSLPRKSDGG